MQAKARAEQARHDLEQAELNLRYCDIVSEIDGVVTSRNVNPGNDVQAGQSLMAVRSVTEIWIDANFKETQLADLRIGQRVRCEVDMYGGRKEFEGRITGFTMGTGQTLALLPPQNATGNFVKIVQRLPVRIELTDYDPDKAPLFVGLSVTPYVYYKEPPTGPNAGEVLQPLAAIPTRPTEPKTMTCEPVAPTAPPHVQATGGQIMSSCTLSPAAVSRPAVNHWVVAVRGRRAHVHGDPGHHDRERGPAVHRRRPVRRADRRRLGHHQLPGRQRHRPADHRLAVGPPRPPQLLPAVDRRLHPRLGTVRLRHQPGADDPVPGDPGAGRRRAPAVQPGGPDGRLPAREAGHGHDAVRGRRHYRAHRRADAGRLALRRLRLAVDLPHQRPDRPAVAGRPRTPWSMTPIISSRSGPSLARRPLNFDYIGLGLLALVMSCWEIMLSKGQEWDWLGDPFGRVQTLVTLFVLGLGLLIVREMRTANPIINFRVLGERNLAVSCVIMFCRLRRGVRREHRAAGDAPVAVRLRRPSRPGW